MNNEKRFHSLGEKGSYAMQASMHLNEIILEKYLTGILPKDRNLSLKEINKYCVLYNFNSIRDYLGNNFYRIIGENVFVIADNEFLAQQAKSYCKHLILKFVIPSQLGKESYENRIEKYIKYIDFTADERAFIDLMLNEIMSISSIKEYPHPLPDGDLIKFNWVNSFEFYHNAKSVYNGILQKKLHAGDYIFSYIEHCLAEVEIADKLRNAAEYDYFFDKSGFLKCDLETNRNILIKNFLNTIIYDFKDNFARAAILQKLNAKYPFLISE